LSAPGCRSRRGSRRRSVPACCRSWSRPCWRWSAPSPSLPSSRLWRSRAAASVRWRFPACCSHSALAPSSATSPAARRRTVSARRARFAGRWG
ncbi:hypothetical protein, partial [Mesorhizobium sp.]|uniref:hypothetical protein n=1 Tax=Mesorhizobium sp. TaxID=1871066 RepID=UPI00345B6F72